MTSAMTTVHDVCNSYIFVKACYCCSLVDKFHVLPCIWFLLKVSSCPYGGRLCLCFQKGTRVLSSQWYVQAWTDRIEEFSNLSSTSFAAAMAHANISNAVVAYGKQISKCKNCSRRFRLENERSTKSIYSNQIALILWGILLIILVLLNNVFDVFLYKSPSSSASMKQILASSRSGNNRRITTNTAATRQTPSFFFFVSAGDSYDRQSKNNKHQVPNEYMRSKHQVPNEYMPSKHHVPNEYMPSTKKSKKDKHDVPNEYMPSTKKSKKDKHEVRYEQLVSNKMPVVPPVYGKVKFICPPSFSLVGNKCVKVISAHPVISCPYGAYRNQKGHCVSVDSVSPERECPPGFYSYDKGCVKRSIIAAFPSCPHKFFIDTVNRNQCLGVIKKAVKATCTKGVLEKGMCVVPKFSEASFICPNGFTKQQGKCTRLIELPHVFLCKQGYTLSSDPNTGKSICSKILELPWSPSCPEGFYFSNGQCVKDKLFASVSKCPPGFTFNPSRTDCIRYANTTGELHYANTPGKLYYANTTGEPHYANTTGGLHYANTTGEPHYENTTPELKYADPNGVLHYANATGELHYTTTIGELHYTPTIGELHYVNATGVPHYTNTIGVPHYANTIGVPHYANTTGEPHYGNTIGEPHYANALANATGELHYANTTGVPRYANTIDVPRYANTIGELHYANTTGGLHYANTTGEPHYENTTAEPKYADPNGVLHYANTTGVLHNATVELNSANTTVELNSANTTVELNSANTTVELNSANTTAELNSANTTAELNSANTTAEPNSANTTAEPNYANANGVLPHCEVGSMYDGVIQKSVLTVNEELRYACDEGDLRLENPYRAEDLVLEDFVVERVDPILTCERGVHKKQLGDGWADIDEAFPCVERIVGDEVEYRFNCSDNSVGVGTNADGVSVCLEIISQPPMLSCESEHEVHVTDEKHVFHHNLEAHNNVVIKQMRQLQGINDEAPKRKAEGEAASLQIPVAGFTVHSMEEILVCAKIETAKMLFRCADGSFPVQGFTTCNETWQFPPEHHCPHGYELDSMKTHCFQHITAPSVWNCPAGYSRLGNFKNTGHAVQTASKVVPPSSVFPPKLSKQVKKFEKKVKKTVEQKVVHYIDQCERVEYATVQVVCPVGYKMQKLKKKKGKGCITEKIVPATKICEPGFFIQHDGNCVKRVEIAPSIVNHDGDPFACKMRLDGTVSCGHQGLYQGKLKQKKIGNGRVDKDNLN